MNDLSQLKIVLFLKQFKKLIEEKRLLVIPRKQNQSDLIELGITDADRKDILLELSVEDYIKGPEEDTDRKGDIWVFGKEISKKSIYIKLKIDGMGVNTFAKCLSFHIAEYPLSFPYKP